MGLHTHSHSHSCRQSSPIRLLTRSLLPAPRLQSKRREYACATPGPLDTQQWHFLDTHNIPSPPKTPRMHNEKHDANVDVAPREMHWVSHRGQPQSCSIPWEGQRQRQKKKSGSSGSKDGMWSFLREAEAEAEAEAESELSPRPKGKRSAWHSLRMAMPSASSSLAATSQVSVHLTHADALISKMNALCGSEPMQRPLRVTSNCAQSGDPNSEQLYPRALPLSQVWAITDSLTLDLQGSRHANAPLPPPSPQLAPPPHPASPPLATTTPLPLPPPLPLPLPQSTCECGEEGMAVPSCSAHAASSMPAPACSTQSPTTGDQQHGSHATSSLLDSQTENTIQGSDNSNETEDDAMGNAWRTSSSFVTRAVATNAHEKLVRIRAEAERTHGLQAEAAEWDRRAKLSQLYSTVAYKEYLQKQGVTRVPHYLQSSD